MKKLIETLNIGINTKKTLDTSKTAKVTWFILVLHWAVDVSLIEVIYYIYAPVEY